jgi:DNA polymerase III alpha subunit
MYGVIDFYKACMDAGIKPILGCEVYVANGSRFQKEDRNDARYDHLVLLAENEKGYQNLMALVSKGFTEGFYYKPRIDFELLQEYHEGLIALSACIAGVVARPLLMVSYEKAKEMALRYKELLNIVLLKSQQAPYLNYPLTYLIYLPFISLTTVSIFGRIPDWTAPIIIRQSLIKSTSELISTSSLLS